jgi:hypothetical protein
MWFKLVAITLKRKVVRIGNSLRVTIPKEICDMLKLDEVMNLSSHHLMAISWYTRLRDDDHRLLVCGHK